ncbi:MAG: hypothetical protein H7346_00765 [Burkholderiaceae bacterium]|nr:hypothetical protein [Burkholderiaceae bacterium]
MSLTRLPPVVISNGIVLYLTPSDAWSLLWVSRDLQQVMLGNPRLTVMIQQLAIQTAHVRSQMASGDQSAGAHHEMLRQSAPPLRNRIADQWRQTLLARIADGRPVPGQDVVLTLTGICKSLRDSGATLTGVSNFEAWPMHEVIHAIAQVAWAEDDVAESFHLVVPAGGRAQWVGWPDAWNEFEYRALSNAMSALHQLPVTPSALQDFTAAFSSSPPDVGPDGTPESQTWSVEHTDRATGAKSTMTASPAGAEPEISELTFTEASGRMVSYVHLFNHTGEPIPAAYGIVR